MVRGHQMMEKNMTLFYNQSDLEHLNVTELRWLLREAFNALSAIQKSSAQLDETIASIEAIESVLRRKINCPKP
jgi:hypothetical protein